MLDDRSEEARSVLLLRKEAIKQYTPYTSWVESGLVNSRNHFESIDMVVIEEMMILLGGVMRYRRAAYISFRQRGSIKNKQQEWRLELNNFLKQNTRKGGMDRERVDLQWEQREVCSLKYLPPMKSQNSIHQCRESKEGIRARGLDR